MHIPQTQKISPDEVNKILAKAGELGFAITYEPSKHQVILEKDHEWIAKIYLPWTWEYQGILSRKEDCHFALVMIKAGQASLGYFHEGILLDHKVIRAYMIRQKQGKSQIKYLKTKGKSRAGSRIRLAESERFFEEINERLTSYFQQFPIDFWGISCSKTLWHSLFSSDTPPPFASDDSRLIELPFHVVQASFEEIQEAGKILSHFHLLLSEGGNDFFASSNKKDSETEDW